MVVVADGSDEMAERIERVLTTDPGTGVLRHADAGYEPAYVGVSQPPKGAAQWERARSDAALRRAWHAVRGAVISLRHRREAARVAEEAIKRTNSRPCHIE